MKWAFFQGLLQSWELLPFLTVGGGSALGTTKAGSSKDEVSPLLSHDKAGRGSILTGKGALQWCLSKGQSRSGDNAQGQPQSRSPDKTSSDKAAPSGKSSPGLGGRKWAGKSLSLKSAAEQERRRMGNLCWGLSKSDACPTSKPAVSPERWDVLRAVTVRSLPHWNCPVPPSPFPQSPHFKMPACQGSQEQNTLQLLVPCLAIGYIYMVIPA